MASKKKTRRSSAKHPSPAMISDLKKLMKKHNWTGKTLMWKPVASAHLAMAAGQGGCPPGQSPHQISYQLPDGTWVNTTVCS